MAIISPAFVTLFDAEVKQAYQASRALAGLTREKSVTGSSIVKFPKLAKGVASVRTPQSDVVPMNVAYSTVQATMADFIAAEYSDIFDQSHVNFSDRAELVQAVGHAIGRRMDQVTIDALVAATPIAVANTVAEDGSAGAASDLNTGKIRAAKKALDTNNTPPDNRCLLIHAASLSALLSQTSVTSSDFNTIRALVDGSVDSWLGFDVITIGDRTEGGLPKSGANDRSCFAFHKDSMGLGMSMGQKTEVNYVPEKVSFLVASMFGAGAVAIEDGAAGGVVEILCREA